MIKDIAEHLLRKKLIFIIYLILFLYQLCYMYIFFFIFHGFVFFVNWFFFYEERFKCVQSLNLDNYLNKFTYN